MPRSTRLLGAAVLSCALVLAVWRVAAAHATLVSSQPAANGHLTSAPREVRLVFNEPIETSLGEIALVDASGRTMKLAPHGDPHDVHALVAAAGNLASGAYRLVWRVVSADGHPVNGSFVFSIGEATMPPPPDVELEQPGDVPVAAAVLRGAGVGCLMALAGLLVCIVVTGAHLSTRPGRAALATALAAVLLLAAHLVMWARHAAPDQTAAMFAAAVGRVEIARIALTALAAWALVLARRPVLALVFATGALLVSGAVGHSAAISPLLAIPMKGVHLVASALWLGGLLWLVLRERNDSYVADARRVSDVALIAVILVFVTGLVQMLLFLPSLADVARSTYGVVALAKIAGFGVLVAFGAYHRFRLVPRIASDGRALASSVTREIVVFGIVVLIGGFLAYIPPPASTDGGHASNHESSP